MDKMIIQDGAGNLYIATEPKDEALAHCYWGVPARRLKGAVIAKKQPERLIRKEGTKIINLA